MEYLSDTEREQRSVEAIRQLSQEIADLVDLRGRVSLARSILAHRDDPVYRQALLALDGASLADIAEVAVLDALGREATE